MMSMSCVGHPFRLPRLAHLPYCNDAAPISGEDTYYILLCHTVHERVGVAPKRGSTNIGLVSVVNGGNCISTGIP